jgi:hypothetical protein
LKPLLVIFRPRDLSEFLESQRHIKIDKLWINYYPQTEAFKIARDECLKTDYTHFLFIVDDNIITQNGIDLLLEDSKQYDVIGGWMNCDTTTHKDDANISLSLPPNPPNRGRYEDYHLMTIKQIEGLLATNNNLITISYQGFALCLIKRKILELIPFRDSHGCCPDSLFALDLHEAVIKQYCDLRVRCKHLKVDDKPQTELLQVGKKPAYIELK